MLALYEGLEMMRVLRTWPPGREDSRYSDQ